MQLRSGKTIGKYCNANVSTKQHANVSTKQNEYCNEQFIKKPNENYNYDSAYQSYRINNQNKKYHMRLRSQTKIHKNNINGTDNVYTTINDNNLLTLWLRNRIEGLLHNYNMRDYHFRLPIKPIPENKVMPPAVIRNILYKCNNIKQDVRIENNVLDRFRLINELVYVLNEYMDYILYSPSFKSIHIDLITRLYLFSKDSTSSLNNQTLQFTPEERNYLGNVRSDIVDLHTKIVNRQNK